MDITYHYPPELFSLLIDTIPLLNRSKMDTILFFKGAGVEKKYLEALEKRVKYDRDNISKYEIVRTVLKELNEGGESTLRERRELLKRITQFDSFSSCWASDQLKAKGLVAEVRNVINVKDSFTRMNLEREREKQKHQDERSKKQKEITERKQALEGVKRDLYSLFSLSDEKKRGILLEGILNRLFEIHGILIRESFKLMDEECKGIAEQIDGVIEIDGALYLVEMKWTKDKTDIGDVSRHLVRVYHRNCSRAIFISSSGYTTAAIKTCKEALQLTVIALFTLEEIVWILDSEKDLMDFLRKKINAAITDKIPFFTISDIKE